MDELSQLKSDFEIMSEQAVDVQQGIVRAEQAVVKGKKLLLANQGARAYIVNRIEALEGNDEGPEQDS